MLRSHGRSTDDEARGNTAVLNLEVEQWKRHFALTAEGKLRPNRNIVENVQVGSGHPGINFVTPLAKDIELAKSELKMMAKRRRVQFAYKSRKDFSMRPLGIPGY